MKELQDRIQSKLEDMKKEERMHKKKRKRSNKERHIWATYDVNAPEDMDTADESTEVHADGTNQYYPGVYATIKMRENGKTRRQRSILE